MIRVANEQGPARLLKRSVRHLIPIEASTDDEASPHDQSSNETDQPEAPQEVIHPVTPQSSSLRPRRQAAVEGEALRRSWTMSSV